ncbi:type II toxin-antitoxin system RelE/ParE family toxin [Marivirga sp.]|uniref:type II toxin-antitoxin system RelE/ParE family toxin n=1 Tax=Marivirga sp. TaxID=2018662 RepID=UPI002D804951|nr:type II toxin-antitoxin system RelE/ParE family toxin [Marivirga sp.]HET8860476.1 type II toxin-antitoxin system RelE/ParE family toxin [Marivirga sp.]
MKYYLIVKPDAELDILKSAQWYEEKQESLGVRFLNEVEQKLRLVTQYPLNYQVRYRNIRLVLLKHFPYAIHFRLDEQKIIVLAVLGTREDPEKWL